MAVDFPRRIAAAAAPGHRVHVERDPERAEALARLVDHLLQVRDRRRVECHAGCLIEELDRCVELLGSVRSGRWALGRVIFQVDFPL